MKKYPVVNGKSLCSVYKKFLKEIFCVEGHLLLVGVVVYDPHADFYKIRSDWGLKKHD